MASPARNRQALSMHRAHEYSGRSQYAVAGDGHPAEAVRKREYPNGHSYNSARMHAAYP